MVKQVYVVFFEADVKVVVSEYGPIIGSHDPYSLPDFSGFDQFRGVAPSQPFSVQLTLIHSFLAS